MPKLVGKIGEWDLPHVHMWKDRANEIKARSIPLISETTRIATIGSCFAAELAAALDRFGLNGGMHPVGLFYNTRSIRQELERIFGQWSDYRGKFNWRTKSGFVHPFKDYKRAFSNERSLQLWSDDLDRRAEALFKAADVIVITLGLIEVWVQPTSGKVYREIPHPEVFSHIGATFHRLTVCEMIEDLKEIRHIVRRNTNAEIILTVSPVPLHATVTPLDVRVANSESKGRIRAAVSEFVDSFPDVHYFHSFEIVSTAERPSDFMLKDGRHVHKHAIDYILQQFLLMFGNEKLAIPTLDTAWLMPPTKSPERIALVKSSISGRWRSIVGRLASRL